MKLTELLNQSDTFIHLQGSQAPRINLNRWYLSDTFIHLQGSQA